MFENFQTKKGKKVVIFLSFLLKTSYDYVIPPETPFPKYELEIRGRANLRKFQKRLCCFSFESKLHHWKTSADQMQYSSWTLSHNHWVFVCLSFLWPCTFPFARGTGSSQFPERHRPTDNPYECWLCHTPEGGGPDLGQPGDAVSLGELTV